MKRIGGRLGLMWLAGMVCLLGMTGCGKKTADTQPVTTQQETTQAVTDAQKEEQSAYVIALKTGNSWESNGMQCAQFDGTIRNETKQSGSDWKVTVEIPEGAKLENGWNGTYNLSGTTLEITPVDYNQEIAAGTEITFGFILDTAEAFTPENVVLSIAGGTYAPGDAKTTQATQESATTEAKTEEKEIAAKDVTGSPVANHGALSVQGTDLVDRDGKVFQLKGVSTHGINWFPDYVNQDAFSAFEGYGANAIRLAMYTADNSGYCTGGDQQQLRDLLDQGVKACTELGMYVIIDWHILSDGDPNQYKDAAKEFFAETAKKYKDSENVIYEICNEPNGGTSWESVKSYAEEIIPVIRAEDSDAVIIVGTPNWSQDVDLASENPIEGQKNIMYAAHFYAATHKEDIRNKVKKARENGLPVLVSECSICDASGNGSIDYDEAQKWIEYLNDNHISYFAWNLSNKDEQSSLLKSSVTKTGGFTQDDFSDTGKWFIEQFSK